MPNQHIKIEGEPVKVGSEMFCEILLPAIQALSAITTPKQMLLVHAGILTAMHGSLIATEGKIMADSFLEMMVKKLKDVPSPMPPAPNVH